MPRGKINLQKVLASLNTPCPKCGHLIYASGDQTHNVGRYHGREAREKILRLLDVNHDGILTSAEKKNGRIIIYGHTDRPRTRGKRR